MKESSTLAQVVSVPAPQILGTQTLPADTYLSNIIGQTGFSVGQGSPYQAARSQFGSVWVSKLCPSHMIQFERQAQPWASPDHAALCFFASESGGVSIDERTLDPNQIRVCPSGIPFRVKMLPGAEINILRVPMGELSILYSFELSRKLTLSKRGAIGQGLWGVWGAMRASAPELAPYVGQNVIDVVGCTLASTSSSVDATQTNPLLLAGLHQIALRYGDSAFGVSELADTLGVSTRTLQRVFQLYGATARRRLLIMRLWSARERLVKPHISIEDVLYRCGFEDRSYFHRAYVKQFGVTPKKTEADLHYWPNIGASLDGEGSTARAS